jgi:hypothetical protein
MKLKRLLFLGLLFTTQFINAQTDFRSGYVIIENNDTLFGEIDYRGDLLMSEVCRFRINDKANETKYSPDDIVAYRFKESKYFISKDLKGKKIFLEFLIKGKVNIYYLRDSQGDHYYLEKENMRLTEIPYEERIVYKDNTPYFYKSTRYIGLLKCFMDDAPMFQSRIDNMGKPEHENLIKLAEDYHNEVCKDTSCIIYEKKLPLLRFDIEITGGIVNYQNAGNIHNKSYFQGGILTHFWMPRTSEKLYFRTGILYSTLEANNVTSTIYKIPIQLEYIYPKGVFRPIIAYGINLYSPFYQTVAWMGGVNIKLHQSIFLGINYDVEFNPNYKFPLFPYNVLSQSISTGLQIKF